MVICDRCSGSKMVAATGIACGDKAINADVRRTETMYKDLCVDCRKLLIELFEKFVKRESVSIPT